jgi:hypothetical protein
VGTENSFDVIDSSGVLNSSVFQRLSYYGAVHCLRKVLHDVRHAVSRSQSGVLNTIPFSLPETLDTEDGGGDNTSGSSYCTIPTGCSRM